MKRIILIATFILSCLCCKAQSEKLSVSWMELTGPDFAKAVEKAKHPTDTPQ